MIIVSLLPREDKEMHCDECGFVANKRVTLNRHLFMKHNKVQ